MFYPGRLCIPFGLECNFSCKYCYRDTCRKPIPTKPTKEFLSYVQSLPNETYAIIASGGEPLLHLDTVKEVFEAAPRRIHRKIMTNGALLTRSIVDYINENDIEVHLSHDGEYTEYLRGFDIFENEVLLKLVKEIENLRIVSVITNKNPDVMDVYHHIKNKLKRQFYFDPFIIDPTGFNDDLIVGFDYDAYQRSLLEYLVSKDDVPTEWYQKRKPTGLGFNYLLDGSVVGIRTLNKYGTVWDSLDTLKQNFYDEEKKNLAYCNNNKSCRLRNTCHLCKADSGEHLCKAEKIRQDCFNFLNFGGISQYVGA